MIRLPKFAVGLFTLILGSLSVMLGAPACADDTTVVTLWTWRPEAPVVADMVAAIRQAHPDIDLRAVVKPASVYFLALHQAMEAGLLPDIIGLPPGAETQRLRPQLQDIGLSASGFLDKKWRQYYPRALLDDARLGNPRGNDALYLLPMTARVAGVWYDRAAFTKAGLTAPPETLDDLLADGARLRAAGLTPLAIGGANDAALIGLFLQIATRIDPHAVRLAEDGHPSAWTGPEMVRAATIFRRVYVGLADPDSVRADETAAARKFAQGHAAMSLLGSGGLHSLQGKLAGYGEFPFPKIDPHGQSPHPLGGIDVGWALTKNASGSPEVERASHKVLRDLLAGPGAQIAVDARAGLPAWTTLTTPGGLSAAARAVYAKFAEEVGNVRPDVVGTPAMHDALAKNLRALAAGQKSAQEAIDAVAEAARAEAALAR